MDVPRHFNTAGPCNPAWHYMVPPLPRLPEAPGLVDIGAYFVVHAPRQTGKTTTLAALAQALTEAGRYAALYFSCEAGEAMGEDVAAVERILLANLHHAARFDLPEALRPPPELDAAPGARLQANLTAWAERCPRPLVLVFDEIDALRGESLRTVLRQLRAGYKERPGRAPWSVILCGLRDVRDYEAASGGDPDRLGTSSPFNIKLKSLRLGDFTFDDVQALLRQHTQATGQVFTEAAIARAFEYAQGQPWLTNALAAEVTQEMKVEGDITEAHVDQAKERLVLARATHLDSLVARLMEPRVRRVVEPIIAGELAERWDSYDDDVTYVRDLGLVTARPLAIANPIYREVIVRVLAAHAEDNVTHDPQRFVLPDGRLDFEGLIRAFKAFWVEHGEILSAGGAYHEVAAQLVLMAFMQRLVNGGGHIDREYGVGRGRIDLLVRWPLPQGGLQREAVEIKVRTERTGDPLAKGLAQLDAYLDRLGLETGLLAIFDRRPDAPPIEARTQLTEATTERGRQVRLLLG